MGNSFVCYKSIKESDVTPDSFDTPTSDEVPSIVLSTDPSLLCSRIPYGAQALKYKREALERNTGLRLFKWTNSDGLGRDLLRGGMNALRAQVLDLNMLCDAMKTYRTRLTHANVASFFDWLGKTLIYFERYIWLEDDIIFNMFLEKGVPIRGAMSPSKRMLLRGRLQKSFHDLYDAHLLFRDNQPAGETFAVIPPLVENLTALTVEYTSKFMLVLVPLIDEHFRRSEIDRTYADLIRYILNHDNTEDNIVIYTLWMNPQELKRWKRKSRSVSYRINKLYSSWEKHIYEDHFKFAALFADKLYSEANEHHIDVEIEIWKANYSRITAQAESDSLADSSLE